MRSQISVTAVNGNRFENEQNFRNSLNKDKK